MNDIVKSMFVRSSRMNEFVHERILLKINLSFVVHERTRSCFVHGESVHERFSLFSFLPFVRVRTCTKTRILTFMFVFVRISFERQFVRPGCGVFHNNCQVLRPQCCQKRRGHQKRRGPIKITRNKQKNRRLNNLGFQLSLVILTSPRRFWCGGRGVHVDSETTGNGQKEPAFDSFCVGGTKKEDVLQFSFFVSPTQKLSNVSSI
jgi:hypothetical protein